jgi:hypothetical protein
MSAVPAARYLPDFGADADAGRMRASGGPDTNGTAGAAAKLDDAFARGTESGAAAAQAQFDIKLEELRRQFAVQLAAERQTWATGAGERLANSLLAAVKEFEGRIAETTARILKPFLTTELHRQAVAELQASLEVLLAANPGVSLHVTGPADVLEALRHQLSGKTPAVTYTPSDDCDVRIVAGQATLETRLKDWMAKLDEAVA